MFNNKFKQKSLLQRFLFFFGLLFFLLYLFCGIALIVNKSIPFQMEDTHRILFGVVLIVYGFFRFYRLWSTNMGKD